MASNGSNDRSASAAFTHLPLHLVPRVKITFALVERVALASDNFAFTTQALALLGQGGLLRCQRLVLMGLSPPKGCAVGVTGRGRGEEPVGLAEA